MSKEIEIRNNIAYYENWRRNCMKYGQDVQFIDNTLLLLKAGIGVRAINVVARGARYVDLPDFPLGLPTNDLMTCLKRIADGEMDSVILEMPNSGRKTLAEWKTGAERLVDRSAEYYAMYI